MNKTHKTSYVSIAWKLVIPGSETLNPTRRLVEDLNIITTPYDAAH
jgi:hypothetical protein